MPKKRLDLYGECNTKKAPVDVFTEQCCNYCMNDDCTRSQVGKSHFEARVGNWFETLFSQVPRMTPDDPRYAKINAQQFLAINPSVSIGGWGEPASDWVDPRDAKPVESMIWLPPTLQQESVVPEPVQPPVAHVQAPSQPAEVFSPKLANSDETKLPIDLATANTPVQRNQMLPRPNRAPAADGWTVPAAPAPIEGAKVVRAGAKIKLGNETK